MATKSKKDDVINTVVAMKNGIHIPDSGNKLIVIESNYDEVIVHKFDSLTEVVRFFRDHEDFLDDSNSLQFVLVEGKTWKMSNKGDIIRFLDSVGTEHVYDLRTPKDEDDDDDDSDGYKEVLSVG